MIKASKVIFTYNI